MGTWPHLPYLYRALLMTTNIILTILIITSIPFAASADILHLKDGTTIKVSKVWEEDGFVRFHLPNYNGITITYSKDIIARIEKSDGKSANQPSKAQRAISGSALPVGNSKDVKPASSVPPNGSTHHEKTSPVKSGQESKTAAILTSPKPSPMTDPGGESKQRKNIKTATQSNVPSAGLELADYRELSGVLFYNPRRTYKYWSGLDGKHHTLDEALATLAQKFGQTPEWVAKHIGDTNDLGQIHINLSRTPLENISKNSGTLKPADQAEIILFYDPRRKYKYWVSEESRFQTLNEAVDLLAGLYNRPPEWIKANLGETNIVNEIHENLARAKSGESVDNSQ